MSTTTTSPSVSGITPPTLEELDPEERMSRREIETLQLERLQQIPRSEGKYKRVYDLRNE